MNERTGQLVASDVELAVTRAARRRGLLRRDALDPSTAFLLSPCCSIHTAFMRFPIDAIFLDRDGVVRRIVSDLKPWRAAVDVGAWMVVEMAGGAAATHGMRAGDRLYLSVTSDRDDVFLSSTPSFRRIASNPACAGS
ncbi:MAG TPA: DUF192 domain-containing protein [Vicinamibacterales bacterium]|nr:DUF192 domain-containing protein [Vicinamibacterales bacterium]